MNQESYRSRRRNDLDQQAQREERFFVDPSGWHLDKKVPLAFILALIVQTVLIVIAFQDVKRDTALNTAAISVAEKAIGLLRSVDKDNQELVRIQYQNLSDKLDRLIERRSK